MSAKPRGRVYLDPLAGHFTLGTWQDLAEEQITPTEGMKLRFWMDDADDSGRTDNLLFEGTIHYEQTRRRWFVTIDQSSYRHESEEGTSSK